MLDSILLANHVLKTRFLGWNRVCKSWVPALKNQRPFSTSFFLLLLQLKNHDPSTNIEAALRIKLKKEEEGRTRERERKRPAPRRRTTFPIRRTIVDSPLWWEQVVHSCKLQGHIKYKWEGYLGDVGLSRYPSTRHPTPLWQNREGLAPQSGQNYLMAGQVPTTNISCDLKQLYNYHLSFCQYFLISWFGWNYKAIILVRMPRMHPFKYVMVYKILAK